MPKIKAVLIDEREPDWVQNLTFDKATVTVTLLPHSDIQIVTDEGQLLLFERKTPSDFLNSLREERVIPQIARMSEAVLGRDAWAYLVITGAYDVSPSGNVMFGGRGITGWKWSALWGALLTIQEMGVFVVFAVDDDDFQPCIKRIVNRDRSPEMLITPPRLPVTLSKGQAMLATLPGIGTKRLMEVLDWAGGVPAHALVGLVDLEIDSPIGIGFRKSIRRELGLKDKAVTLDLIVKDDGSEVIKPTKENKLNV